MSKLHVKEIKAVNGVKPSFPDGLSATTAEHQPAVLDGTGRVPAARLPLTSDVTFKGVHDASGGTYPAAPTANDLWLVSVPGTLGGTPHDTFDRIAYDGAAWHRIPKDEAFLQSLYDSQFLPAVNKRSFAGGLRGQGGIIHMEIADYINSSPVGIAIALETGDDISSTQSVHSVGNNVIGLTVRSSHLQVRISNTVTGFATLFSASIPVAPKTRYDVVVGHDGTDEFFYVNGIDETLSLGTFNTGAGGSTVHNYLLGARDAGGITSPFYGVISYYAYFNFAPTLAEAAELPKNGIEAFKVAHPEYKGAKGITTTSGTLTAGKRYRIKNFVAGDDFTNIGAGSNATGEEFTATGTTPTTWTNGSEIIDIGIRAAYTFDERLGRQFKDISGNDEFDALASTTGVEHLKQSNEGSVRVKAADASSAIYMLEAGDILPEDSVVTKLIAEGRVVDLTNAEQDLADRRIRLEPIGSDLLIRRSDGTTHQTLGTVTAPASLADVDVEVHYKKQAR